MLHEGLGIIDDRDWDDTTSLDWRAVDRALRDIALRRSKLDAEEARWLREADRLQIWRPLGMVSALDYLERVLGHTPHVANERLRVARSLGDLPVLTDAFARGELHYSAIRELTRVATPATENRWRDAGVGKNVQQIEELVAGHRRGDDPEDPPDPEIRTHVVRFELGAEVFARLRQVRAALTDERGGHFDNDQLVTALCDAVLDRASAATEPTGRAKFQIAVTVCERCDRGWQEGAGAKVPIDTHGSRCPSKSPMHREFLLCRDRRSSGPSSPRSRCSCLHPCWAPVQLVGFRLERRGTILDIRSTARSSASRRVW